MPFAGYLDQLITIGEWRLRCEGGAAGSASLNPVPSGGTLLVVQPPTRAITYFSSILSVTKRDKSCVVGYSNYQNPDQENI
jgi:hypothetical protein